MANGTMVPVQQGVAPLTIASMRRPRRPGERAVRPGAVEPAGAAAKPYTPPAVINPPSLKVDPAAIR